MKTGKRIAVLLLVFIAAAVVYFIWPLGHKEENGVNATYTAMGEAALPVVYPTALGYELAPLFGQREEKAVTAARDSLLVLPEDRKLSIRIEEGSKIKGLRYEIRSLDMEHLVERTELTGWSLENGQIQTELPIQNLLEKETEYQLGLCAELSDGTGVWYYARIMETDNSHVGDMLALAEEFSEKTFHYESAQDLTMYMESSPSADNSSFGTVTLKNSFTQMTWGSLGVLRNEPVRMTLKELSGDLANIQLDYFVSGKDQDSSETYAVTENFTMKWATQRIYMMDYERRMNQVFTGGREAFSGKRIILGISDSEGIYSVNSPKNGYTAYVVNRELWMYDSAEGKNVRVFAFGGAGTDDLRANVKRHGVEILEMDDEGNLDFLVYGYMNRGNHEGYTGITYNHYSAETNTLEEQFFIPAAEPYEELAADVEKLAHKGENGILYLYMGNAVYGIDLKSHEYVVVASGLDAERFSVSSDGSRLAWQENTGVYDSRMLQIMDLDTGEKTQIGDGKTDAYRILGFVGSDCIYGSGEFGDYVMSNGRVMGLYLKALDIVDKNMGSAMHYEKPGYYIRDVQVDDSRIHMKCVQERNGGFFGTVSEDTLVCNAETLPGKTDNIGWYASDVKGRVYFVQLAKDIASGQKITAASPKKLVMEDNNQMGLETFPAGTTMEFYAYGRGRLLGSFADFADAANAAYDCMGFVTVGRNQVIWARANRASTNYIRDISAASRRLERYRSAFTGESILEEETVLLDASGASLNQVLYFVGQNMPVLVYTGEGSSLYLTGHDQGHVRVFNPVTGQTETLAMDSAAEEFERLGNDFICCVSAK